jgi:hypothetical protein
MRRVRALSNDHTPLQRARNGAPFHFRTSRGTLSSVARALVAARLLLNAVEIGAALRALLQEQMLLAKDSRFGALDFHEDWGFHIETHSYGSPGGEMSESHIDVCGKCAPRSIVLEESISQRRTEPESAVLASLRKFAGLSAIGRTDSKSTREPKGNFSEPDLCRTYLGEMRPVGLGTRP